MENPANRRARQIEVLLREEYGKDEAGDTLRVILFQKDEKLRAHALKHIAGFDAPARGRNTALEAAVSALQEAGCPYFKGGALDPPCETARGRCPLWDKCSPHARALEDAYLEVVKSALKEGGLAPRYARFYSDWDKNALFCLMPRRPMVVKASRLEGGDYNLMTCYADPSMSFTEMRDMQLERIRAEARRKNIDLCSREGWGLVPEGDLRVFDETPKTSRKNAKKPRIYRRESGSWRRYLELCEKEFGQR
jgi:hypothetical protein